MSNRYYGNLIPSTFFTTRGSGESDLEKHASPYYMALYDASTTDYNITVYSSVPPATVRLVSPDKVDVPPFSSELKVIMSVSYGIQGEFVGAGVVYAWIYKDENFDERARGPVCEVNGYYRIEELESRLIRVINDLHQNTYSQHYLDELNFITGNITVTRHYGMALAGLCLVDFVPPEPPMKDGD